MSIVYQSWIQVKGILFWGKRWLLIQSDGTLKFYHNEDLQSVSSKAIDLKQIQTLRQSITTHKEWKYGFVLISEKNRTYLSSQTKQQRDECMHFISNVMDNDAKLSGNQPRTYTQLDDIKYDHITESNLEHNDKCTDCGKCRNGTICDDDGLFYCTECWENYTYETDEKPHFIDHNLNEKTIFYITHKPLTKHEEFKCCYSTSSYPNSNKTARMNRILHSLSPLQYSVYIITIKLYKFQDRKDMIFLQLFRRNFTTKEEKQILHRCGTLFKESQSNHPITRDNDKYIWNITANDVIYILHSKGKPKTISMEYHTVVLREFMHHLYKYLNSKYSPYLVMETFMSIYALLTDKSQLNLSCAEDTPAKMFIVSLVSRCNSFSDKSWSRIMERLISLFVMLRIEITAEEKLNTYCDHECLLSIFQHFTDIYYFTDISLKHRIEAMYKLCGENQQLISSLEELFLRKKKRCKSDTNIYLLWYNLLHYVSVKNNECSITLNKLLHFLSMDQRIANHQKYLSALFTEEIMQILKHFDMKEKHDHLYDIMDAFSDMNCLYLLLLQKYEAVIFDEAMHNAIVWSQFMDYILSRVDKDCVSLKLKDELLAFILNKFCTQIANINNREDADVLYTLYKQQKEHIHCDVIIDCILENEYLMTQSEFIFICSVRLHHVQQTKLDKCINIWRNVISTNELIEIFEKYEFDWKLLVIYLCKSCEKLKKNNDDEIKQISANNKQLQHENENQTKKMQSLRIEIQRLLLQQKTPQYIEECANEVSEPKKEEKKKPHQQEFETWLCKTLDYGQYLRLFVQKENDDIRLLKYFDKEYLKNIGIQNNLHCKFIADSAKERDSYNYAQEGRNQKHINNELISETNGI